MKKNCEKLTKIIKEYTILIPNIINEKYDKLNEISYCKYKTLKFHILENMFLLNIQLKIINQKFF